MEDFIILKTGYDIAIKESLETLQDLSNFNIIKNRLLRQQKHYNGEYQGTLYKFYDKKNQIGYIIFDDIYELKGVCLFIEEGKYKEIDESELVFIMENINCSWKQEFNNKDFINMKYQELLNKFKRVE